MNERYQSGQQWASELRLSLKSNWNANLARRSVFSSATFPREEGRSQAAKSSIFTCTTGKSQNSEEGAVSFFVRASERWRKAIEEITVIITECRNNPKKKLEIRKKKRIVLRMEEMGEKEDCYRFSFFFSFFFIRFFNAAVMVSNRASCYFLWQLYVLEKVYSSSSLYARNARNLRGGEVN